MNWAKLVDRLARALGVWAPFDGAGSEVEIIRIKRLAITPDHDGALFRVYVEAFSYRTVTTGQALWLLLAVARGQRLDVGPCRACSGEKIEQVGLAFASRDEASARRSEMHEGSWDVDLVYVVQGHAPFIFRASRPCPECSEPGDAVECERCEGAGEPYPYSRPDDDDPGYRPECGDCQGAGRVPGPPQPTGQRVLGPWQWVLEALPTTIEGGHAWATRMTAGSRGSGRTTRMLDAAEDAARRGGTVLVLAGPDDSARISALAAVRVGDIRVCPSSTRPPIVGASAVFADHYHMEALSPTERRKLADDVASRHDIEPWTEHGDPAVRAAASWLARSTTPDGATVLRDWREAYPDKGPDECTLPPDSAWGRVIAAGLRGECQGCEGGTQTRSESIESAPHAANAKFSRNGWDIVSRRNGDAVTVTASRECPDCRGLGAVLGAPSIAVEALAIAECEARECGCEGWGVDDDGGWVRQSPGDVRMRDYGDRIGECDKCGGSGRRSAA